MSKIETRIADDGLDQFVLDRLELSRKLDRAGFYINRVQQRLKALERQRQALGSLKDIEDVSDRFDVLEGKSSRLSKEL